MVRESLERVEAPGLSADWLNAWLAAIGVTVLLPGVKLSWTDDVVPYAIFWIPGGMDLAHAVYDALPSEEDLGRLPIARVHPDSNLEFPRTVSVEAYRARARIERSNRSSVLAACVTDLVQDERLKDLPHSPFDTPAPRGKTLWSRLVSCRRQIMSFEQIAATFAGVAQRVKGNGLGFDCKRAPVGVRPDRENYVDPVVEVLAFYGLRLFPLRGDGRWKAPRMWTGSALQSRSFIWFSWPDALDWAAIDAVLDQPRLVAARRWGTVPYQPAGSADPTRSYFSELIT
jgi:hypothetical protein